MGERILPTIYWKFGEDEWMDQESILKFRDNKKQLSSAQRRDTTTYEQTTQYGESE